MRESAGAEANDDRSPLPEALNSILASGDGRNTYRLVSASRFFLFHPPPRQPTIPFLRLPVEKLTRASRARSDTPAWTSGDFPDARVRSRLKGVIGEGRMTSDRSRFSRSTESSRSGRFSRRCAYPASDAPACRRDTRVSAKSPRQVFRRALCWRRLPSLRVCYSRHEEIRK